MGFFRFQRRIKLFPGVHVNLSKSGISTTVGVRGAKVTLGHGQTRTTVGIPGTGISYTDIKRSTWSWSPSSFRPVFVALLLIFVVILLFIL
jgi:hypothetical protein